MLILKNELQNVRSNDFGLQLLITHTLLKSVHKKGGGQGQHTKSVCARNIAKKLTVGSFEKHFISSKKNSFSTRSSDDWFIVWEYFVNYIIYPIIIIMHAFPDNHDKGWPTEWRKGSDFQLLTKRVSRRFRCCFVYTKTLPQPENFTLLPFVVVSSPGY